VTNPSELRALIKTARSNSYALDYEESTPGLCCVAAPVYDAQGQIVAGMSVSVPNIRFTDERRIQLLELIRTQANSLSTILGYRVALKRHR